MVRSRERAERESQVGVKRASGTRSRTFRPACTRYRSQRKQTIISQYDEGPRISQNHLCFSVSTPPTYVDKCFRSECPRSLLLLSSSHFHSLAPNRVHPTTTLFSPPAMASSGTSPALRRILNRSTPGLDYSTEEVRGRAHHHHHHSASSVLTVRALPQSAAGRQGAASPGPSTQPPRSASRMSNSVQMRSTAGRELVAWLAEDAAAAAGDQHPPTSTTAAAPLSSQSLNGRSSRMSLRHVFSPELPPPPRSETPKTPRYESETLKRRQQRTPLLAVDSHHHSSTATSWDHPVSPTPDHRLNNGTAVARRASGARSSLDIRDRADRRTSADLSNGTLTMRGNVDEMDKLEIYYKCVPPSRARARSLGGPVGSCAGGLNTRHLTGTPPSRPSLKRPSTTLPLRETRWPKFAGNATGSRRSCARNARWATM